MSYEYSYAFEKFSLAVRTLAVGPGDVRARLQDTLLGELLMIETADLPEQLQADYEWVRTASTKFEEPYEGANQRFATDDGRFDHFMKGSVESTMRRIRRSTGAKIAAKIYHIWSILDEECRGDSGD